MSSFFKIINLIGLLVIPFLIPTAVEAKCITHHYSLTFTDIDTKKQTTLTDSKSLCEIGDKIETKVKPNDFCELTHNKQTFLCEELQHKNNFLEPPISVTTAHCAKGQWQETPDPNKSDWLIHICK